MKIILFISIFLITGCITINIPCSSVRGSDDNKDMLKNTLSPDEAPYIPPSVGYYPVWHDTIISIADSVITADSLKYQPIQLISGDSLMEILNDTILSYPVKDTFIYY